MIKRFLLIAGAYMMGGIMVAIYFQPKITKLEGEVVITRQRLESLDSSMSSNMHFRLLSIEDRRVMQLKLDSILANQNEQKVWHWQAVPRTASRDAKIDSINNALKSKGIKVNKPNP